MEETKLEFKSGHYITSIVEVVAGAVVFLLSYLLQDGLDMLITPNGRSILIICIELIFLFRIIKSIFGRVVFTISKYSFDYFIGVFNMGVTNSIPLDELQKVFVESESSRGGVGDGGVHYPNSKSWKMIIRTEKKDFEILSNSMRESRLYRICESLNTEIHKYKDQKTE